MAPDPDTAPAPAPSPHNVLLTAVAVAGCFLVFAGIVWLVHGRVRSGDPVVDLAKVDAADRWRFTVEGRAARLAEVRAKADAASSSYAWIDAKAGVVRLPIDRAMELVVKEHLQPGPSR